MQELPMPVPVRRGMDIAGLRRMPAADILKIPADAVLVASTGVIGMQIPIHKIVAGVQVMSGTLDGSLESGINSARAIMTTDTKKKEIAVTVELGGKTVTIGGRRYLNQ